VPIVDVRTDEKLRILVGETRRRLVSDTLARGGEIAMKFTHVIASLALVLGFAACKKGGGGAGDMDAFMKLDSDKAAAFAVGGEDCVAKAKSVGDWRKAHTAEYNAMRKKLNELYPKGPPQEMQDKYGTKMKENKKAVMDAMLSCSSNEAFGKMMDETKTAE
jgi:hypothetical protein